MSVITNQDKKYTVYAHIFPNGKRYIGMTGKKPEKRWKSGYSYNTNEPMFDDIVKYGWDNIEHKILYKDLTRDQALELEMYCIIKYKTAEKEYGYNILKGTNMTYRQRLNRILSENKQAYSPTANVVGSIYAAARYGNTTMLDIDNCCKGKYSTAGEKDGKKLKWEYKI